MKRTSPKSGAVRDQAPHSLLGEEETADAKGGGAPHYRAFPFRPGAKPGPGNVKRAEDALAVFAVLHKAYKAGEVTQEQLGPLFFRSTSDLITYREGWKAGKFWSRDAWRTARKNGHTNGLVSEHVLPRSATLKRALELDWHAAQDFVWQNSFECVVTREENSRLKAKHANPLDPWERYAKARIKILDVHYPRGTAFLEPADRQLLSLHGILVRR